MLPTLSVARSALFLLLAHWVTPTLCAPHGFASLPDWRFLLLTWSLLGIGLTARGAKAAHFSSKSSRPSPPPTVDIAAH